MKPRPLVIAVLITAGALASGWLFWLNSADRPIQAPDFTVSTLDNAIFHLAEHRGQVVVIQFFAPWCVTCMSTATALNEVVPEWNASHVRVLTISTDPSIPPEDLKRWRNERNYTWPFALDTDQVAVKYGVYALGRVVIVDGQGMIAFSKEGTVSAQEFRIAVAPILP